MFMRFITKKDGEINLILITSLALLFIILVSGLSEVIHNGILYHNDPYIHMYGAKKIIGLSSLPESSNLEKSKLAKNIIPNYPYLALLWGLFFLLSGLDFMISGVILKFIIITTTFLFLLLFMKSLFDDYNIGILCALICWVNPIFMDMEAKLVYQMLGILFMFITLFYIVEHYRTKKKRYLIVSGLFFLSIIYTHHLTAVMTLIFVNSLFLIKTIDNEENTFLLYIINGIFALDLILVHNEFWLFLTRGLPGSSYFLYTSALLLMIYPLLIGSKIRKLIKGMIDLPWNYLFFLGIFLCIIILPIIYEISLVKAITTPKTLLLSLFFCVVPIVLLYLYSTYLVFKTEKPISIITSWCILLLIFLCAFTLIFSFSPTLTPWRMLPFIGLSLSMLIGSLLVNFHKKKFKNFTLPVTLIILISLIGCTGYMYPMLISNKINVHRYMTIYYPLEYLSIKWANDQDIQLEPMGIEGPVYFRLNHLIVGISTGTKGHYQAISYYSLEHGTGYNPKEEIPTTIPYKDYIRNIKGNKNFIYMNKYVTIVEDCQ